MLIDALGRAFLERHAEHPLLRRMEITPLESQFPSTTTAHLTTLYTTLPVGEHGLYEWNVYEPSLDAVILPLRFVRADAARTARRSPAARTWSRADAVRAPGRRRDASTALQPKPIARSRYGARRCAARASSVRRAAGGARRRSRPRWPSRASPTSTGTASTTPATWPARRARSSTTPRARAGRDRGRRSRRAAPARCCSSPPTTARSTSTPRASTRSTRCGRSCSTACAATGAAARSRPPARRATASCTSGPGARRRSPPRSRERLEDRAQVVLVEKLVADGLFGAVGPRAARPPRRRLRPPRAGPDGLARRVPRPGAPSSAATTAASPRPSATPGSARSAVAPISSRGRPVAIGAAAGAP